MTFALVPLFFESGRGLELLGLLFTIWMASECLTRERERSGRILWLLLILLVPAIGPLIYFFARVVNIRV
jgi:hypothetical protein